MGTGGRGPAWDGGPVHRSAGRLADGREIVYYDQRPGVARAVADRRVLGPRPAPSQIRQDPLLDEPVTIAAHRQTRTFLPAADECPLCPSRPGRHTEIPAADYDVVVLENRFPAYPEVDGGRGRCEVVCFTSAHDASFAQLGPARARLVTDVWADRTAALSVLAGVEHVFCFENRGEAIGVTLHHPHGQVYGYPFVPPRVARMLDVAARHRQRTGRDLFADVLAAERRGPRVVVGSRCWTAYVPAAARWPVEVHLTPHRAVPDLVALDEDERDDLVAVHLDVLRRLDALHGTPLPYVAGWYQAPVRAGRDLLRLHLQVISPQRTATRLKYLAGSEVGMGAYLNDVSPEDLAARLRAVGT